MAGRSRRCQHCPRLLSFAGAYLAVRFLVRYLQDPAKTLTPFAVCCVVAGLGSLAFLTLH